MFIQRPELKQLAESVGLNVSLYPMEVDRQIGVGCDIFAEKKLVHHLSTLEIDNTSTIEDATQLVSLLVAKASILINDYQR